MSDLDALPTEILKFPGGRGSALLRRRLAGQRRFAHAALLLIGTAISSTIACAVPPVLATPAYNSAPAKTCKVTHAWDSAGQAVAPPAVVICAIARYPDELLEVGQEGQVIVRVLVDSAGVPDSASIHLAFSQGGAAFERAVRAATPFLRFAPSVPGAKRVALLEIPTTFTITHRAYR